MEVEVERDLVLGVGYSVHHDNECPWYYFDDSYKILLGCCLIIVGVFGVLINGWLFVTFIHSHILTSKSHILVLNLCTASLGRNLFGFPFAGSSALTKRWLFGPACCQFYACLNHFLGIFQMFALFALVLERYLVAKFYRCGRSFCCTYYCILIGICWAVALVFAIPPLFGYGLYSCDSTGTSCTLLWPALESSAIQLGYCIPYVLLCGIAPVIAIFICMRKTNRLERIYYRNEIQREQKKLTKSIHASTIATLILWIPAAVLAGYQWFPQMIIGYRPHVPSALAIVAPIFSEAATSVPVLCYLALDERLRIALLGRKRNQYTLRRPDRAKQNEYIKLRSL